MSDELRLPVLTPAQAADRCRAIVKGGYVATIKCPACKIDLPLDKIDLPLRCHKNCPLNRGSSSARIVAGSLILAIVVALIGIVQHVGG